MQTTAILSDYRQEHVRPLERVQDAPDLLWKAAEGVALEKHAKAMNEYADEENKRVEAELKRRTLESKARQEKALADKMESEARMAQVKELEERIKLFDELRRIGAAPVWNEHGDMHIRKAPPDFAWDPVTGSIVEQGKTPETRCVRVNLPL